MRRHLNIEMRPHSCIKNKNKSRFEYWILFHALKMQNCDAKKMGFTLLMCDHYNQQKRWWIALFCFENKKWFSFLPVCPLLMISVLSGGISKPCRRNGDKTVRFTESKSMLIGLWCLPVHVLYCSPQWEGPEK